MSKKYKDKIGELSTLLQKTDEEINHLQTSIVSSEQRLKDLSEIAFEVLSSCLIEKQESIYILSGRLPDNLVRSLKSKKIIHFVQHEYLWYVDDIEQFVKRIEYRMKRGLDVSCEYTYKNVLEYTYEYRLNVALNKFYEISDEIEYLENLSQGKQCEPLHLYSGKDKNLYYELTANLKEYQHEYDELIMFVNSIENIPKRVFKLLAKQQETLLNELLKSNELLHNIKIRYRVIETE